MIYNCNCGYHWPAAQATSLGQTEVSITLQFNRLQVLPHVACMAYACAKSLKQGGWGNPNHAEQWEGTGSASCHASVRETVMNHWPFQSPFSYERA
jgi:hypothetical protein